MRGIQEGVLNCQFVPEKKVTTLETFLFGLGNISKRLQMKIYDEIHILI
jgi:hypothetical protein